MTSVGDSSPYKCVYCRTTIPEKVKVCPTCKKSQNRLGNWVLWLSGAAGLFTFVGSAIVFLYSAAVLHFERIYGADLEARNVSSMKTLTVFNNSSSDVLVESIEFEMPGGIKLSVILDQAVAEGAVSNVDIGILFERQTTGPFLEIFGRNFSKKQVFQNEIGTDVAKRITDDLSKNDYGPDGCGKSYTVEAINEGGVDYNFFGGDQGDYLRVPCEMEVRYRVVRGRAFSLNPPCVGIVKYRNASKGKEQEAKVEGGLYRVEGWKHDSTGA